MKQHLFLLAISLLLICCQAAQQDPQSKEPATDTKNTMEKTNPVIDYLQAPGPISFNRKAFLLTWSSHPSANYYKHEYLPKGESQDKYDQMIMLEVALGDLVPQDIANGKAAEIEGRKRDDVLANYMLSENQKTGEVILDFILSTGVGETAIVEWNSYRYKSYIGPSGQKGIMLFAYSKRAYGTQINTFASDISLNRKKYAAEFERVDYPEIKLLSSPTK